MDDDDDMWLLLASWLVETGKLIWPAQRAAKTSNIFVARDSIHLMLPLLAATPIETTWKYGHLKSLASPTVASSEVGDQSLFGTGKAASAYKRWLACIANYLSSLLLECVQTEVFLSGQVN